MYRGAQWAPNVACAVCCNALLAWFQKKRDKMPFRVPMQWANPGPHNEENCYACANTFVGQNRRKRHLIKYIGVPCVTLPALFDSDDEGPSAPSITSDSANAATDVEANETDESSYVPSNITVRKRSISKSDLDDIVRCLKLSQNQGMDLAKKLKICNVLEKDVKTTSYKGRQAEFAAYFTGSPDNTYAYCSDIEGVMRQKKIRYVVDEWRLFIDSSKSALKAVLLYFDNSLKPIPVFYGKRMKETYVSMELVLSKIKYNEHEWRISCDLKVTALLRGLQGGYTKYCCFLCLWDSRSKENQYLRKEWPPRRNDQIGKYNIANMPLVRSDKILLPPLHIKLGIVTNFLKKVVGRENVLAHLKESVFPHLSYDKLKAGEINAVLFLSHSNSKFCF